MKMQTVRHAARIGDVCITYRTAVEITEDEKPLTRPTRRWENITIYLFVSFCKVVVNNLDCITSKDLDDSE
jgi:hypothetical protein